MTAAEPTSNPGRVFLDCDWRALVMLNYRVPDELLQSLVPRGTELDRWNGSAWVSVVGFMFENVRVLGIPVPFHQSFEEVNLRFYVRRSVSDEVRHAVTFVRELVPRRAIAVGARLTYNEPYLVRRMRHDLRVGPDGLPLSAEYAWRSRQAWSRITAEPTGVGASPARGSHEEFITVRHWGYTTQPDGTTVEYDVRHPRWKVWALRECRIAGNLADAFGLAFADVLSAPPDTALFADGSPVTVHTPRRLGT